MIQHDVVIIGSGIAGMRCALEIKRQMPTADVAIVTKQYPTRAPSVMDRNGIAAAFPSNDNDRVELHANDTVVYGGGANNRDAVQFLCENAATAVYELEHMGLPFDRTKSGKIAQRKGFGHLRARLAYASDHTGHSVVHTLYGELVRFGIKVYPEFFLLNLISDGNAVHGIVMLDIRSSEVRAINAKATVLATGSYGRIFATTGDANTSTGDGHVAALRAGVKLSNMDRVMFHPLGLACNGLILSEHLLHDGAKILNSNEQQFTDEYGSMAQICRDIEAEIAAGRGAGEHNDHVWLDLRDMPSDHIREFHPSVIEYAHNYYGIDPFRDLLPIKPTVSATLGGIPTDLTGRVEGFDNLYAVGACADNGVHGERALAGNEVTAALVFAKRTGSSIVTWLKELTPEFKPLADDIERNAQADINTLFNQKGENKLADLRDSLLTSVSKNNGFTSDVDLIQQQVGSMREIRYRADTVGLSDKNRHFNTELVDALELDRMVEVAGVVAQSRVNSLEPTSRTTTTPIHAQAPMAEHAEEIPAMAVTESREPVLPDEPASFEDRDATLVNAPAEPLPPIARPAPAEPLKPIAKPAPAEPTKPILADAPEAEPARMPVIAPAEPLPPIVKPAPAEPLTPAVEPAPAVPSEPILADDLDEAVDDLAEPITTPINVPAEPLPPLVKPAPVEPLSPMVEPAPAVPSEPILTDDLDPVEAPTAPDVEPDFVEPTNQAGLTAGPYANSVMALPDNRQPEGYLIKGNMQSMLYHVPGSRYYKATKAELWFATEEDAIKAGFSKPSKK